ncbi:unnamed protein product [Pieris macdunnoughi]|uniref:Endonuclease/exonuclease/phosphatase domain-containing protein n=1 Tax=Pieris macdunnoughi TaxID=345717 RepID=A0A821V7N1_9NEOP|nr:unnamed protein product [Pieris macdunnoughi]
MEAKRKRIAVALIQEPYVGPDKKVEGYKGARIFQCLRNEGETTKAAVVVFDSGIDITQFPELTTPNVVVVGLRTRDLEIVLVSYYFEPVPHNLTPYMSHLMRIHETLQQNIIIAGDANAKNIWWCSQKPIQEVRR